MIIYQLTKGKRLHERGSEGPQNSHRGSPGPSWSHRLPLHLARKPLPFRHLEPKHWVDMETRRQHPRFSFLALSSGVSLSGPKLPSLQPLFLRPSHLSLQRARQWAEEASVSLAAPRSGCWGLGCGCSPCLVLAVTGRLPLAESPLPQDTSFTSAVSPVTKLSRALGQRCRGWVKVQKSECRAVLLSLAWASSQAHRSPSP